MNIIRKRDFEDTEVILDYNHFKHCNFEGCTLIYHGNGPSKIRDCNLDDTNLQFVDSAENTLNFLRSLFGTEMEVFVLEICRRLLGEATPRLMKFGESHHLTLDAGPLAEENLDTTKEQIRSLTGKEKVEIIEASE